MGRGGGGQVYPYTQPWALAWNYRKRNLLREILSYRADILALQEIQADHFREFLEPELRKAGYDGVYKQKTRESMGQDGKMDGCAIMYRRNRWGAGRRGRRRCAPMRSPVAFAAATWAGIR